MKIEITRIRKAEGTTGIHVFMDIEFTHDSLGKWKQKGFRVASKSDGTLFVGLPSRKGSDGKYHAQFIPDEESPLKKLIDETLLDEFKRYRSADSEKLKDAAIVIHEQLHRGEPVIMGKNIIEFKGTSRGISFMGYRFITQNKDSDTSYGKMAQEGKKITWVCHGKEYIAKVIDGVYYGS